MKKLLDLLREFEAEKLYGEVLVKFEAGKVTIIKKTESIRP